jgi:hypothetical protein
MSSFIAPALPPEQTQTDERSHETDRRKRHRHRRRVEEHSGRLKRLRNWLYRKHGLTLEVAFFLLGVFGVMIFLAIWFLEKTEF